MKKNKQILLKASVILILVVVFFLINEGINSSRKESFKMYPDGNGYVYQVEDINIVGDELVIKGWFFELKNSRNKDRTVTANPKLGVLLFDLNSKAEYDMDGDLKLYKGINTEVTTKDREDINEYFKCEYNYSHCGFEAKTKLSEVDLENNDYQIVFKLNGETKIGVMSDAYIHKGELIYVSPADLFELNIQGTDLEKIVNDGVCLASSKESNVCIYQYNRKIYWITTKDSFLEDDGSTFIQYQIDTTQYDRLPQNRIEEGSYWDNIGGAFEKYEITNEINCGDYRVSVRDIPKEYAIVRILTGYYVNGVWIWEKNIRPLYSECIQ